MLQKGALELVDHPGLGYYSPLFLVHKMSELLASVIDLLSISSYVTLTNFKMKIVFSVLELIRKGDFMFLIVLKDNYFQVPFYRGSYLQIALGLKVYQFKALCIGLSTASQVFNSVFAQVSEWTHKMEMRLLWHLDD